MLMDTSPAPPRRNRVTPFGEIMAVPEYGDLMGNRGCLHDGAGRIVRRSARKAWIACLPRWPGVHRRLMAPGRYTELFFLDEATALAAGHRPCASCRPLRWAAFRHAWAEAHDLAGLPLASDIDAALAIERAVPRPVIVAADVPDGAIAALPDSDTAWLRWQGHWHRWSFAGYGAPEPAPADELTSLTCDAIRAVLTAGYTPEVRGLTE